MPHLIEQSACGVDIQGLRLGDPTAVVEQAGDQFYPALVAVEHTACIVGDTGRFKVHIGAQAVDLAERQIAEGTASAQVISHFLKLGTTRERLEQEKLRNENKLTEAKIESLASMQRVEELYSKAMQAFGTYSGQSSEEYDD